MKHRVPSCPPNGKWTSFYRLSTIYLVIVTTLVLALILKGI